MIDDLSPILPDSHGHPDISSILWFGSKPDYSRWFFPTVRIHSSVIWSRSSACLCLHSTTFSCVFQQKLPWINPNKTATHVTKTETNRAFCYLSGTFSYLSAWVWWESGIVRQRRAAILNEWKEDNFNKIPARPFGADLWQTSLCSPRFSVAPKGTMVPK